MWDELLKNWPIVLSAVGFTVWLVRHESKTIDHDRRIDLLEENNTTQNAYMEQMALDVREMKTDIKWIKERK